jgi:son of sevenless-like protein
MLAYPLELARQLTVLEHHLFKTVSPLDLVVKVRGVVSEGRGNSERVDSLINHFNVISSWAASTVLQHKDLTARVQCIERWIVVAHRCWRLRNFGGVMEVVAALGMTPVRRLTETWANVSERARQAFEFLEGAMSPTKNFRRYRAALQAAEVPLVPYFGVFLRDLTFMQHGATEHARLGMVHTAKLRDMSSLLETVDALQQGSYPFLIVPEIRKLLLGLDKVSEDVLFELSRKIQPPGARPVSTAAAADSTSQGSASTGAGSLGSSTLRGRFRRLSMNRS